MTLYWMSILRLLLANLISCVRKDLAQFCFLAVGGGKSDDEAFMSKAEFFNLVGALSVDHIVVKWTGVSVEDRLRGMGNKLALRELYMELEGCAQAALYEHGRGGDANPALRAFLIAAVGDQPYEGLMPDEDKACVCCVETALRGLQAALDHSYATKIGLYFEGGWTEITAAGCVAMMWRAAIYLLGRLMR